MGMIRLVLVQLRCCGYSCCCEPVRDGTGLFRGPPLGLFGCGAPFTTMNCILSRSECTEANGSVKRFRVGRDME